MIAGNTDRGLEVIQEAIRLDPFSVQPRAMRAWILTVGQRYAEAVREYEGLVARVPEEKGNVLNVVSSLALAGWPGEAARRLGEILPTIPSARPVTLAVDLARAGDAAAARDIVKQAVALKEWGGRVPASGIAAAYAVLGTGPRCGANRVSGTSGTRWACPATTRS
ncbi:MAG: hypothetical protein P8099_14330 [Gemmatimonadota bacterium]